jgi:protein TonB
VTVAGLLISQVKPLPSQETFQWNVSLVELVQKPSFEPIMQDAPPPAPQSQAQRIRPAPATSQPVFQEVQARPLAPVVAAQPQQPLESPKAVEQSPAQVLTQPTLVQQRPMVVQNMATVTEARPVREAQSIERPSESVTQSVDAEQRSTSVRLESGELFRRSHSTPTVSASVPMAETQVSIPAQPADETEIVSSQPVKAVPEVEPTRDDQMPQVAAMPKLSITPPTSVELAQPVTKAVQQTPATRADYGWLIESLGSRLAELKRYPVTARGNGLEGKVLLRAVIRADGYLAEVSVQKSSGHQELDAAAVQTMRDASPLYLRHELGRAQIAITVPLVYRLAN